MYLRFNPTQNPKSGVYELCSNDEASDFFIHNCIEKGVSTVWMKVSDERKVEQHKAFWLMIDTFIANATEETIRTSLDLDAIDLGVSKSALKGIIKDALMLKTGRIDTRMVLSELEYQGQKIKQTVMMPAPKSIAFDKMGQEEFYNLYQDCSAKIYDALREQGMTTDQIENIFGNILKL